MACGSRMISYDQREYPPWYKKGREMTFHSSPFKPGQPPDIIGQYDDCPKKGLAIIMTNDFEDQKSLVSMTATPPLPFVYKDGIKLWHMFRLLDFDIIWHVNFNAEKMLNNLEEDVIQNGDVGKMIVCCISSHGEQLKVKGQDGNAIPISKLVDGLCFFRDPEINAKLAGKPKIFFIDTCQGEFTRTGSTCDYAKRAGRVLHCTGRRRPWSKVHPVSFYDVPNTLCEIARHADVLLGFAAYQNTAALGNKDGSFYINELVKYLLAYNQTEDIQVILAAVCNAVQSIIPDPSERSFQQLPMVFSTLTKKLIIANDFY